jgi:hypothetical protein
VVGDVLFYQQGTGELGWICPVLVGRSGIRHMTSNSTPAMQLPGSLSGCTGPAMMTDSSVLICRPFRIRKRQAVASGPIPLSVLVGQLNGSMKCTDKMKQLAESEPYKKIVGLIRCFYGIDTLTAISIITELFEFGRFANEA